MKLFRFSLLAAAAIALTSSLMAQVSPKENPLAIAAKKLGTTGFSKDKTPEVSPLLFKPSGERIYVDKYLTDMFGSGEEKAGMQRAVLEIMESFEKSFKEGKVENDGASALALSLTIIYAVVYSAEVEGNAIDDLTNKLKATLNSPEIQKATDKQKQEFYEWSLASSAVIIAMAAGAETPEQIGKVQALASAQIKNLIGTDVANLVLKGKTANIVPKKETSGSMR